MSQSAALEVSESCTQEVQLAKHIIALIALVQGLVLALIYSRIEDQLWPATSLPALNAIVVFSIAFPSLFILISCRHDYKKIALYLLAFCSALALLGAYIGSISLGKYNSNLLFVFSLCAIVASFKAALYIKCIANKTPMTYAVLFTSSWRNFVLSAETALFCGIFFGILYLGASLFSSLGISIFEDLLDSQWFWVPALTLSASLAIHVFRNIIHTIDTAATILQTLMKFLLPLLVFISIGFICTLPFAGLEKLWATGSGTGLVLTLQALTLFFVNAVYHEGSDKRPYSVYLHRGIILGVAVLPIYSIIAAHGLWLRVDQYGFTVQRSWAVSIWFIFALFSVGYFVGIVKLRDNWLLAQSKINVAMGVLVMLLAMLVQSPLINFQGIAASSQLARLDSGKVTLENFDFDYFFYHLQKPGKEALEKFKLTIADEKPDIAALIDRRYAERSDSPSNDRTPIEVEHYWPSKADVPLALMQQLKEDSVLREVYRNGTDEVHVVKIDANDDGIAEFLIFNRLYRNTSSWLYYLEEGKWEKKYVSVSIPQNLNFNELLENNDIKLKQPKWQDIQIGDIWIEAN